MDERIAKVDINSKGTFISNNGEGHLDTFRASTDHISRSHIVSAIRSAIRASRMAT